MKINNQERIILDKITKKYLKIISNKSITNITRIESAIMAIEMYNRNCVWRFFEYLFLFISSIFCIFTGKLDNISIGRYQLKLSYILDYLKVSYSLKKRSITLVNKKIFPFFLLFINRNKTEILTN